MKVQFILLIIIALFLFSNVALGSTIDGTINAQHNYAWSTYLGWFNFVSDQGNIHVTDSELTGYIWNQNYGWINLAPGSSGVKNDGEGHLSGFSWGENIGWGDFGGVTIDANGIFHGSVRNVKLNLPSLTFDCDQCSVITDWRPASVRAASQAGGNTGGSGSNVPANLPPTPLSPMVQGGETPSEIIFPQPEILTPVLTQPTVKIPIRILHFPNTGFSPSW